MLNQHFPFSTFSQASSGSAAQVSAIKRTPSLFSRVYDVIKMMELNLRPSIHLMCPTTTFDFSSANEKPEMQFRPFRNEHIFVFMARLSTPARISISPTFHSISDKTFQLTSLSITHPKTRKAEFHLRSDPSHVTQMAPLNEPSRSCVNSCE